LNSSYITIKQELIDYCVLQLESRAQSLGNTLHSIKEAQANETKSSAGDKFETSREMMQREIDKLDMQLGLIHTDIALLKSHRSQPSTNVCAEGNMVFTDKGSFLISVGLGKVKKKDVNYFVISKDAPIAKSILGLHTGDSFSFNNKQFSIERLV